MLRSFPRCSLAYAVACATASALICSPRWLSSQPTRCVRAPQSGAIFSSLTTYRTSRAFDAQRHAQSLGAQGRFTKVEFNPYAEFGLTSSVTAITNVFVTRVAYHDGSGQSTASGFANPEVALRYDVSSIPVLGAALCGIQLGVKLPARSNGTPSLGLDQTDVEARLLSVHGFTRAPSQYGYTSVEVAYRYRAGAPADEIRVDATLGVPLSRTFQLVTQAFTITGLRNHDRAIGALNPTAAADYDLYKGQLSLVTTLSPHVRLQLGGFAHLLGRNTGAGGGGLVSLWTTW